VPVYLVVRTGAPHEAGTLIEVAKDRVLLGRPWKDHRPDVGFDSLFISRRHAEIVRREGGYYLKDLDSDGGTLLNGRRLAAGEEAPLRAGDEIVLAGGEAVLLFYGPVEPGETLDLGLKAGLWLSLNEQRKAVVVRGQEIPLPPKEYALCSLLYREAGRVVSGEEIKKAVWPEREKDQAGIPLVTDEEVKQLVYRLRSRLREPCGGRDVILTLPGHGYLLERGTT
jgi:pSer/pThr/pTyr-binding forkhead associated (FHA) protein